MRLSTAPAAERMRLHRRRRRLKIRSMTVEIAPCEVEALVKHRYLKPEECDDWNEIQFAVRAFLSDQCENARNIDPAPIPTDLSVSPQFSQMEWGSRVARSLTPRPW
jgi:hypothetical protein